MDQFEIVKNEVVGRLLPPMIPRGPFALDPQLLEATWARTRRGFGGPFSRFSIGFEFRRAILIRHRLLPLLMLIPVAAAVSVASMPFQWLEEHGYTLFGQATLLFWLSYWTIVFVVGSITYAMLDAGLWVSTLTVATLAFLGNLTAANAFIPPESDKSAEALMISLSWYGVLLGQLAVILVSIGWMLLLAYQESVARGSRIPVFAALRLIDTLVEPPYVEPFHYRVGRQVRRYWWWLPLLVFGVTGIGFIILFVLLYPFFIMWRNFLSSRSASAAACERKHTRQMQRTLSRRWTANRFIRSRRMRALEDVARAIELGIPAQSSTWDIQTNKLLDEMRRTSANETRKLKLLLVTPTLENEASFRERAVALLDRLVTGEWPVSSSRPAALPQRQLSPVVRHAAVIAITFGTVLFTRQIANAGNDSDSLLTVPHYLSALWIVLIPYLAVALKSFIDPGSSQRLSAMRYYGSTDAALYGKPASEGQSGRSTDPK